jgi:hypothetical protein
MQGTEKGWDKNNNYNVLKRRKGRAEVCTQKIMYYT